MTQAQPTATDMENTTPEAETAESSVASESTSAAETSEDTAYQALEDKFKVLNDQHLRLAADFDNFRKRTIQERDALRKYGAESTVDALLPVLDNLDRGANSLSEASDAKTLYQSFTMLTKQLLDTLQSQGLQQIDMTGQPFDPTFCEAISQMPSAEHDENVVIQTVQYGYQLHDRVLRPARVVVSTGSDTPAESDKPTFEPDSESNPFKDA